MKGYDEWLEEPYSPPPEIEGEEDPDEAMERKQERKEQEGSDAIT